MKSALFQLTIALIVCGLAAIGYGVWFAAVSAKSATVADLQSQIDVKSQTASRIASARVALAEIAGDEAALQNYFVSETGVVSFIDDLQARGQAQGASVNVLSVSAGTGGTHPTLTLTLTVTGAFSAVMQTIGSIEFAPYDLVITTLSVNKDATKTWRADMNITVGAATASAATSTNAVAVPTPQS
ncbi:MAG TPA: hypothetical protein VMV50_02225 [Candidatus Paceibacterota bacterium]|nr:hypothetical protein [Candidatus Paceibacterota bacterium]